MDHFPWEYLIARQDFGTLDECCKSDLWYNDCNVESTDYASLNMPRNNIIEGHDDPRGV